MTPNPSDSATDKTSETKLELSTGTILAGQYKLIELTQTHPILGLTFNAINQQGEGFIVRVDSEENMFSLVRSEAGFLQEVGVCLLVFMAGVSLVSGSQFERPGSLCSSRSRSQISAHDLLCHTLSARSNSQPVYGRNARRQVHDWYSN